MVCDRCSTHNLEGSRFCDGCGAALWMAGRSSSSLENGNGNGSNGNSLQPAPSVAPSGAPVSAEHVSLAGFQPGSVHARLQIERGVSAGKKFTLNNQEPQIGPWDANGGVFLAVDVNSA